MFDKEDYQRKKIDVSNTIFDATIQQLVEVCLYHLTEEDHSSILQSPCKINQEQPVKRLVSNLSVPVNYVYSRR